jgi:hypothetical protein
MASIINQSTGTDNIDHFEDYTIYGEDIPGTNYRQYFVEFKKYDGIDIIFTTPLTNIIGQPNVNDLPDEFEIVTKATTPAISNVVVPTQKYNLGAIDNALLTDINIWFWEFPSGSNVNTNNYSSLGISRKKRNITYASMSSATPPINHKPSVGRQNAKNPNSFILEKGVNKITKNNKSTKK